MLLSEKQYLKHFMNYKDHTVLVTIITSFEKVY